MTMNGTSLASPSSLNLDDSEDSFVVLSRSVGSEPPDQMLSLNSMSSSGSTAVPSMPQMPLLTDMSNAVSATSSMVSELSTEEIQTKLENLLQENLRLKDTLSQNNLAMKKQFNTLVMWQEDVMKVHQSHKQKFEETKKLITNLRAENADLRKATSLPNSYNSNDETCNLKSKISALEFELNILREANIRYKNEQSKVVEQLQVKQAETVKEKDERIAKNIKEIDGLKEKLISLEEQLKVTQTKMVEMKSKIPTAAELQSNEELTTRVKELIAEIVLKQKMLQEKTDLIDSLHEEISKLKIENEVIPILKTQVDVYQTDFNQEREARSLLKQEKDHIAEDLQHLQRRNEQLLHEVESLRENNFVHVSSACTSQNQYRNVASAKETSPPLSTYTCPICENKFRSMRLLDDHIDNCVQNSS